jgi:uncharacterized protein YjbJ (UPF0337 family)
MTEGAQDRAQGSIDELKGRGKAAWGNVTGDQQLQAEGEADKLKGKVERGIGDLKDKAEDLKADISGTMDRAADDRNR